MMDDAALLRAARALPDLYDGWLPSFRYRSRLLLRATAPPARHKAVLRWDALRQRVRQDPRARTGSSLLRHARRALFHLRTGDGLRRTGTSPCHPSASALCPFPHFCDRTALPSQVPHLLPLRDSICLSSRFFRHACAGRSSSAAGYRRDVAALFTICLPFAAPLLRGFSDGWCRTPLPCTYTVFAGPLLPDPAYMVIYRGGRTSYLLCKSAGPVSWCWEGGCVGRVVERRTCCLLALSPPLLTSLSRFLGS